MPSIALDEEGEVGLTAQVNGRHVSLTISYRRAEELVFFASPVGKLPSGEIGLQLLRVISALNLSPTDVGGLAFAVAPDETILLVHSILGPDYRLAPFQAAFERIFAVSATWKDQIESGLLEAARQR